MSRNTLHSDPTDLDDVPLFRDNIEDGEDAGASPMFDLDLDVTEPAAAEETPVSSYVPDHNLARSRASRRIARAREQRAGMGNLTILLGMVATLLGLLWGTLLLVKVGGILRITEMLAPAGMQPSLLLVVGLATLAVGVVQQRTARTLTALTHLHHDVDDLLGHAEQTRAAATFLYEQEVARTERSELAGEDLGAVLMALQRYDEKLNNLTKATKMYGKPLVEITNQLSDAAHQLAQNQNMIGELRDTSVQHAEMLEKAIHRELEKLSACDTGQDELIRRRMDEMETQLEQALAGHGRQMRERVEKMTQELEGRVQDLVGELQKVSKDSDLRELRQSIADLGKTMRNGLADIASRPPAAAAPSGSSSPRSSAGASDAGGGEGTGPGGLAQSIAGTREAPSKNVMGAIAKLKKMRG